MRASNFELLQIICMFLVMITHYIPRRPEVTAITLDNDFFTSIVTLELKSLAFVCVHCFILISGYFGIKFRLKSFLGLIFQLIFWAIMGVFIGMVYSHYINGEEIIQIMDNLLAWYQARWFISAYLFLFMFSPILNLFIEKTESRKLCRYILIFYLFSTIYGYFGSSKEFDAGLSAVSLFGLYLIGGYLRKSDLNIVKWNKYYDLLGYFLTGVFMVIVSVVLMKIGISKSIYGYLNPLVIIESIFLFQFFRKWDFKFNKYINWISASAFAVFLLHCNYCANYFYDANIRDIQESYQFPLFFIILYMIGVFAFVVIIDQLRILLFKYSYNFISNMKYPNSSSAVKQ